MSMTKDPFFTSIELATAAWLAANNIPTRHQFCVACGEPTNGRKWCSDYCYASDQDDYREADNDD